MEKAYDDLAFVGIRFCQEWLVSDCDEIDYQIIDFGIFSF